MRNAALSVIAALLSLALPGGALSQIQIGTVKVRVVDSSDDLLPGASVVLDNPVTGFHSVAVTDQKGEFTFNNVPFARYTLRVKAEGFQTSVHDLSLRTNIPINLNVRLNVLGASETADVRANSTLVDEDSASTETKIDESFIRRRPGITRNRQLQGLIATTPGWMTENNGLLHVRGVDDGVLYVVDGIPMADRLDAVSASSFDTDMIGSLSIITGNIPAEFGGRSGAVVTIQPKSGINAPFTFGLNAGAGSFNSGDVACTIGGGVSDKLGIFLASSANRSGRFLDPVDPLNFNNRGGAIRLNVRSDWHPTKKDIVLFNVSVNGTDLRVPNDLEQELAGQRQRQQLRDNRQAVSWQHVWSSDTVGNLAFFRASYRSELIGSEFDTPIFARQDRRHTRLGVIGSVTRFLRGHSLKAGVETFRIAPREFFTFAITDAEAAERREVGEAVQQFDADNPFVFSDRTERGQFSWYIQDSFSPLRNLTINAGLRYDRSNLLYPDQQLSPRVGAVYYIAATRTAVRGSFNRLYMPPQVENLLLADSEQARRLSPFESGGAPIRPEKVSAYEVGFSQEVLEVFKLDVAYWRRSFRNFDDPNVFFNTTIIFPNSVAKGMARGLDARLDFPDRRGWSGYLSYTNSRILQTGPINGGLFLTDEFIEIGPGTIFIPDHDQRNVGAFGVTYYNRRTGLWASFSGRHESGVPLEVEPERLEELRSAPGADLVNFGRGRLKPWTVFDFSTGVDLFRDDRVTIGAQFDMENIANRRFAYNFGSPFEGTHFGHPRLLGGRIKLTIH